MSAIITDQIRILNAKNFRNGIVNTSNAYYTFVGLTNASDFNTKWEEAPPSPRDNFNQEKFDMVYR